MSWHHSTRGAIRGSIFASGAICLVFKLARFLTLFHSPVLEVLSLDRSGLCIDSRYTNLLIALRQMWPARISLFS